MKPTCYIRARTLFLGAILLTGKFHSQGSIFISNLGADSAGSTPIAGAVWVGQSFFSGSNPQGYALNSIQMGFGTATGLPSGFSVSLFGNNTARNEPGNLIEVLSGSTTPTLPGIFSYSSSVVNLQPTAKCWIVAKAQSMQVEGVFNASLASFFDYASTEGWSTDRFVKTSNNALNWAINHLGLDLQFAITATAIPEPSALVLLGMGGSFLFTRLARKSRSKALRQP